MGVQDFLPVTEDAAPVRGPGLFQELVRVLAWQGEITAANASAVWRHTRIRIGMLSRWQQRLLIDLSRVTFIDSSAIGIMVRAQRYARRKGLALEFVEASPNVRNVLARSGVDLAKENNTLGLAVT